MSNSESNHTSFALFLSPPPVILNEVKDPATAGTERGRGQAFSRCRTQHTVRADSFVLLGDLGGYFLTRACSVTQSVQ